MQLSWIFIALIPPLLWAMANHIDRFLVTRYAGEGDVKGLLVVSALAGVITLPWIGIFAPGIFSLSLLTALFLIVSGFIYVLALLLYLKAFSLGGEASQLAIVYNSIPLFTFILGYFFLGEVLGGFQIIGGLIILTGTLLLSISFSEDRRMAWKPKPIAFVLLASFLFALFFFLFKFFARDLSYWPAMFWQYTGWVTAGLFLLTLPRYRTSFLSLIKEGSVKMLSLNFFNELLNVVGVIVANSVYLIAPLALVSVTIQGFQSVFVVIIGIMLTVFLPRYGKEAIDSHNLGIKVLAIIFTVTGVLVLSFL